MFSKLIFLALASGFYAILVEGKLSLTQLEHTKSCSCGLKYGSSIVQEATKKFLHTDGAFWDKKMKEVLFVDRFGGSASGYRPETGITFTMNIAELRNQEIAFAFPVDSDEHNYVVAANQTLYLLKVSGVEENEEYTISEIMKVMDGDQMFTKGTTTKKGNLIIGTKPADYKNPDRKKGQAKFLLVDVVSKKVKVIDHGFDFTGGACFDRYYQKLYLADVLQNKIWCYKYNCDTGEASDKKVIFDMADHSDKIHGRVTAITTDTEGHLWIGLAESRQIVVFNPVNNKTGHISVPSSAVNTLAWAGPHHGTLFAGTGQLFPVKDPKREPASGTLLAISGSNFKGCGLHRVRVKNN